MPPSRARAPRRTPARAKGYKPQRRKFRIQFDEETSFPGLDMTVKGMSTGRLLDMMSLAERFVGVDFSDEDAETKFSEEDRKAIELLFEGFADALVSWNMLHPDEDRDDELPPTISGVRELDITDVLPLILSWIDAVSGVDADTKAPSSSGPPLVAGLIPMEALSENPLR